MPTPTSRDHKDGQIRREPHRPDDVDTLSWALTLLPTPTTEPDTGNGHARNLGKEARLLPTQASEWVDETPPGYVPPHELLGDDAEWEPCPECGCIWDDHDADGFCMGSCGGNKCNGRQFLHEVKPQRLLPTPMVGSTSPAAHGQISGQYRDAMTEALGQWGQYAAAIARWEHTLGQPAPAPTMTSTKGNPQLSPVFVEWLMGLPAGWVTDVPGITRNEALKALGNGVVPQQAAAAVRFLLGGARPGPVTPVPMVFDTPDTAPEAPNSGSNRKRQPAGLGNQIKFLSREGSA